MKYLALTFILLIGCGYSNFKTHNTTYSSSNSIVDSSEAAVSTLTLLGYDIKSADSNTVETKVERIYVGTGWSTIELQSWIKISMAANKIEAFCTQRRLYSLFNKEAPWRFIKCTSSHILKRVGTAVVELNKVL